MNYPFSLTDSEWNLLNDLTTMNGMVCWFGLRTRFGSNLDYIYDLEEGKELSLHDGIEMVAEGLVEEDLDNLENGRCIWNELMDKFGLLEYIVN